MGSGFSLTLRAFHVGHPWTPLPVFLPEHVALKHAILPVQVILRTGNGKSGCACVVYVYAYAHACVCVYECALTMCERVLEWGCAGSWNRICWEQHKAQKVSHDLKHGVDLFGFRKNLLHVVWRRECFPSLLSVCSDTTHGNIFWEAMGLWKKKKEKSTRHFISSPSFHSFFWFFSNWLNYTHLLPTCGNISLMNICDAFKGCDVQLVDILIVYLGKNWLCLPSVGFITYSIGSMYGWFISMNILFTASISVCNKYTSTHMRQLQVYSIVCHKYAGRVG